MIRLLIAACIAAVILLTVAGCGGAVVSSATGTNVPPASSSSPATSTLAATTASAPVTASSLTPTPTEPPIPSGSIALFATKSGGSQSDFLRLDGGRVNWDTTHYEFLRYLPDQARLDEFGWTSSKSYSKTYIYGITAGDRVYEVKCFTDSGRKDVSRLDPLTGRTVAAYAPFTTGDMYKGFTVCGDRIIYRSETSRDFRGNYSGGGHVYTLTAGGAAPVKMLDHGDADNTGTYYGIGDDLVTVVTEPDNDAWRYTIYRVDPDTLALGEALYSFGTEDYVDFFAGDSALYWSEQASGMTYIVRMPPTGDPVYFLEISDSVPEGISVDDSGGKVLLTFKDDTPESPFFYLSDIDSGEVTELDADPAFYSGSSVAGGQFIVLP